MHDIYLMMAQNQIADRIREADTLRMIAETRSDHGSSGWSTRIRSVLARSRGQRLAAAPEPAEACGSV
jgi:hypothetical protein